MRFAAGENVVRIVARIATSGAHGDVEGRAVKARRRVAEALLREAREARHAKPLRIYARFLLRSARLRILADEVLAVTISYLGQRNPDDPMAQAAKLATILHRRETAAVLDRELRRALNCLCRFAKKQAMYFFPRAWLMLGADFLPIIARLRQEGTDPAPIIDVADALSGVAVSVARDQESWEDVKGAAMLSVMYSDRANPEHIQDRIAKAEAMTSCVPAGPLRQGALRCVYDVVEALKRQWPNSTTHDAFGKLIEQQARQMGIDIDDPRDPVAEIVRIGLEDWNPDRVLRNCQYLFLEIGPSGVPARLLGLFTAGSKAIHCTKFGYARGGVRLDDIYESFHREHCKGCTDCKPHPSDWKYSIEWHQSETERNRGVVPLY